MAATIDAAPTTTAIAESDVYGLTQADVDRSMDAIRAYGGQVGAAADPGAGIETVQNQLDWGSVDKSRQLRGPGDWPWSR